MSQIDISQWKDVPLNKLFNVARSKSIDKRYLSFVDENTNTIEFIGRTSINNGIQGYVLKDSVNFEPNPSNSLSIIQIGHNWATWHDRPWYAAQNIFCLIPKKDQVYEHNVHMFLQSVINKKLQQYQGFTTYPKVTDIKKMMLKLPVDKNGDPDWQYMDTYIAKLTALAHKNVSSLTKAKAKSAKLDIDQWGEFKISDIYEHIEHPVARSKKHYESGNIPFIASGAVNNGIDCYLAPKNKQDIDKGNCLTISPVDGSCFYQPNDFLGRGGGGSAISILRTNKSLSQATHVFLASIISHTLKEQYSFGNMGNTQKIKDTIIKLPIDAKSEPDWEYMDNQVRHLATLSNLTITSLNPAKLPIFVGEWKEFKIERLFTKLDTKSTRKHTLKSDLAIKPTKNQTLPLIYAKKDNNGIMYYDNPKYYQAFDHCISVIYNGAVAAGLVFPQINKVGVLAEAYLIKPKTDVLDNVLFFLATIVQQVTYHKYSRDNLAACPQENSLFALTNKQML